MSEMIPCPSCKKKISIEAQACPKCGQPITEVVREAARKKIAEDKKNGRIGCIVLIVLLIILGAWQASKDKTDKGKTSMGSAPVATPSEAAASGGQDQRAAKAQVPKLVFNLTPKQFVANYNQAAEGIDTKQRARITKTTDSTVQLEMSKYCGAVLSLAKDGKVSSVMFIGAGDGSALSGADIMLGIAFTIAGIRPDWPSARRGEIITRLIGKNGEMRDNAVTSVDGVKFKLSLAKGVGIFFTVLPEK